MNRSLSPGEQPRARSVSPARLIALLIPVLLLFWLWNTRHPPIREYKLFLTEERQAATLPWHELSSTFSEAELRSRFQSFPIRCMPDASGIPGIVRLCIMDTASLNDVPTMTVHFLFSQDGLQRVATNIPWWAHDAGLNALTKGFGEPSASQEQPHSGVRLHGWRLPSSSTIFYNRDSELPPLGTNSIQWLSSTACSGSPCIR